MIHRFNRFASWVALIMFLVAGSDTAETQPVKRVIGYYPMWYRGTLTPAMIKFNSLTHIDHAFAWPNTDGSLAFGESTVDTGLINSAHRAGVKILLSFGGAGGTQTANFAVVAADTALRRKFIANVVSHLATYHYDGADLDWEGPASLADKANEVSMVQQMRAAFHAADSSWLITMAVGISDYSGQWRDFAALKLSVDWFNAMCYDIFGSWSPYTGHNAPMVDPPAYASNWSVTQGIDYLHVTRGIGTNQIALGIPFFGMRFLNTAGLYQSFGSAGEILYTDARTDFVNGWTYKWDTVSQVPYLIDPTQTKLDSFDDSTSISIKCEFAKTNNLTGIMIWALGEDLYGGAQPLMDAVGKAMSATNAVVPPVARSLPEGYELYANYPNPFNPSTTIRYRLAERAQVSLTVSNALGQVVARLVDETQGAGVHEARFDGSALASGVYFYRIRAGAFVQTKRLVLIR
ncbi:MAG TPA: glycosyl hydrolase family 18 protein [Bacteroidota bacterium]|nr:glycosyl hydrolase family 18 protein [Bacteroidota bacterium]